MADLHTAHRGPNDKEPVMEARLFPEGTVPGFTTPEWYAGRETAPHLEQDIHKRRLHLAADHARTAARDLGLTTIVDLGCGDGGLLSLLGDYRAWGYDLQQSNVDASSRRGVDVRYGSIFDGIEWAEIAIATEVLEHLVDPYGFIREVSLHSRALIASSPFTETAESHYEYHAWAWDCEGYADLLRHGGWTVTRHDTADMFQVITGVRP